MFYYNIDDPLLNEGGAILPCVIQIALELLGRENSRDEIIDEDLHNVAILQAAWIGKSLTCRRSCKRNNTLHFPLSRKRGGLYW
jgi:hypothetical protein